MWILKIKNSNYNHQSFMTVSHAVLRKFFMIPKIKKIIEKQFNLHIASQKIVAGFRIHDDDENSKILIKNVYNVKATTKRNNLSVMTLTQILLNNLNDNVWFCKHEVDDYNQVNYFFPVCLFACFHRLTNIWLFNSNICFLKKIFVRKCWRSIEKHWW